MELGWVWSIAQSTPEKLSVLHFFITNECHYGYIFIDWHILKIHISWNRKCKFLNDIFPQMHITLLWAHTALCWLCQSFLATRDRDMTHFCTANLSVYVTVPVLHSNTLQNPLSLDQTVSGTPYCWDLFGWFLSGPGHCWHSLCHYHLYIHDPSTPGLSPQAAWSSACGNPQK